MTLPFQTQALFSAASLSMIFRYGPTQSPTVILPAAGGSPSSARLVVLSEPSPSAADSILIQVNYFQVAA